MNDGIAHVAQTSDSCLVCDKGKKVHDPDVSWVAVVGLAAMIERWALGQNDNVLGDSINWKKGLFK